MDRALGSDSGNTQKILLFGEPGLGKSLTAMAYAASLGRLVLRTDAEKILSKWHGESEHNLVALFESYKRIADESSLPPVLLLEECDQLLARRGSGGDTSTDISEHRMQSLLLIQIERFEGILIATSNMVDSGAIDEAYSRRFQIKIRFPFPDAETRHALWEAHIPPMIPRSSDIDLRSLAHRYVFTGGQISIACHNSIRAVAIRGDFLKQDDLVCSCEAERSGSFEHHSHRRSETIGFLR
jgi:SpoVK/Ycf46/Vps4 family AAA+-type ATPase